MSSTANGVRPPALAGSFYPAEPDVLAGMVDDFVTQARSYPVRPKALIAPHAGYVYSGPVAGTAYTTLLPSQGHIERVVLLGPCHRVAVRNFAVPSARAFATPLGEVPLDRPVLEGLRGLPGIEVRDDAHAPEHSLEVHLPFLQRTLGEFGLVPIVVGAAPAELTAQLLERLWGDDKTLVVVSSDLSHYHGYDEAQRLDRAASDSIETLHPEALRDEQACGRYPIRGLLLRAAALDLRATTLDLRNSGDTAGSRDRVVGYGSYVFEDAARSRLSDADRRQLLETVGRAIHYGLKNGRPPKVGTETFPQMLRAIRATFVTLKQAGKLRGCVGSLEPHKPLVADAAQNAFRAGFGDNRFQPLAEADLRGLEVSVSILSHPRLIPVRTEAEAVAALKPHEDGVIFQGGGRRGLFLPQVWEGLEDPQQFLSHLKTKAGLPPHYWAEDVRLLRFRTETFGGRLPR